MAVRAHSSVNRIESGTFSKTKKTLRAKIVEELRLAIMDGEFPPGTPLGEMELAKRFRVSRGPIREAIIQLQGECLVRSYPNRGTFVYSFSEIEFDEVLKMRSLLEPLAMEYAKANTTTEHIEDLEHRIENMVNMIRLGDNRQLADRDFEFHCAIWDLSGRQFLTQTLRQITRPLFTFFKINWKKYHNSKLNLEEVIRSHNLILDYLKGTTNLSAAACFQPVIEGTERDEKPFLLRTGFSAYTS